MNNLALEPDAIEWYELAALGPFSYRWNRMHLTHAAGLTVMAETYRSMFRYGWVKELA